MPTASERITRRLIRHRRSLLGLALALGAASVWHAQAVQFDRSIENMFARDDPLLVPYQKLKRTFGGNEIVLAVYRDEGLLAPDRSGLRRLAQVSQCLEAVPGVKGVLSLERPLGEVIVDPESGLAERNRALFAGYTHSRDGGLAAVACMLVPEDQTDYPRQATIDRLRACMQRLPEGLAPGKLTGEPVMVADGFRYVEEDGRRLGIWSSVLLGLTIILCFRSLRWVVIPIAVVQLALLLTRALLAVSDLHLSMVSSMLTAIVTVVGVATVIHVIVRFREARLAGLDPQSALQRTGELLVVPVFWAVATDAVGFAALTVADVGPVRDFGIMMAAGSLMVIVSAALLIPGLALLGSRDIDPRRAWGEAALDGQLSRLALRVQRHPRWSALAALAVTLLAGAGALRLEVETDFTRNFRRHSPLVEAYELVESRLGGAGVCDIILPAPPRLTWEYLGRVERMEEALRERLPGDAADSAGSAGLTKVLSLADAVVAGSPLSIGRVQPQWFRERMVSLGLSRMEARVPEFYRALYGEDPAQPGQHYLRVMLRAQERQPSRAKRALMAQVQQVSREHFPGAEVTGFYVLLTNLIDSVIRDQWLAFAVAVVGIGLMMLVALRDVSLALIALVPNAVPILIVTGLMGWAGLKINMGAAMIAAVSMGLSVDSSIHYLAAFQSARAAGQTLSGALHEVHQSVGRAMVFSTIALIVGFSVLCTSQFVPTIYFGVLVSLAMLGGLAGNLVLLPVLLALAAGDS